MIISWWIDIALLVLSVLVCGWIIGRMVWANVKLKRHLKAEDDRWVRTMKQFHDEVFERRKKEKP